MVVEVDRGGLARTSATVGELLEEWFAHAAPSFSPKCVRETRCDADILGLGKLLASLRADVTYRETLAPRRGSASGRRARSPLRRPPTRSGSLRSRATAGW
jgi:hypothetical protein